MTKLKNRVISIYNRKTSMRLALEEWNAFDDNCRREGLKRKKLLELIETSKPSEIGLTCAVRLFTLAYMHNLAKLSGLNAAPFRTNKPMTHAFEAIA